MPVAYCWTAAWCRWDGALRLAGSARRVVHDRVVELARLDDVEVCRGLGHLFHVVEIGRVLGLGVSIVLVDDDDMFELEELRDDSGDTPAEVGLSYQHLGAAVLEPVLDGVGSEGREQRAGDGAHFENPKEGDVELWKPVHEDEHAVAFLYAKTLEDVGEPVRQRLHLAKGVGLLLAVLALPDHGDLVTPGAVGVAVYGLVGLV